MNRKQLKTLDSIFAVPTRANIKFGDLEKLMSALEAELIEGRGSRIAFVMPSGLKWEAHRPHPQKEAKKYQIESLREFLVLAGVRDE